MKYKDLSRVALTQAYILDLPDGEVGIIEFQVNSLNLVLDGNIEQQIKDAVWKQLALNITLEYDGRAVIIAKNGNVPHPFTGKLLTLQEMDTLTKTILRVDQVPEPEHDIEWPFSKDPNGSEDLTVGMVRELFARLPDDYVIKFDGFCGSARKEDMTIDHTTKEISING